jgi:hypothetical protein
MSAELPYPPDRVWRIMVDIPRIAACIPGCDQIEERTHLSEYSALMRQSIGPFKLEVPATVLVEEHREPSLLKARASGVDKLTRTKLDVVLNVGLAPAGTSGCLLTIEAELMVAGRLASLGYSIIKKKAEENFAEFERRMLGQLELI